MTKAEELAKKIGVSEKVAEHLLSREPRDKVVRKGIAEKAAEIALSFKHPGDHDQKVHSPKGTGAASPDSPAPSRTVGGMGGRLQQATDRLRERLRGSNIRASIQKRVEHEKDVFKLREPVPLTKIERYALRTGISSYTSRLGIKNKIALLAINAAAQRIIPRVVERLSPTLRRLVMQAAYGALISRGVKAVSSMLTLANTWRTHGRGTVESMLEQMTADLRRDPKSAAELRRQAEELVRTFGQKAADDDFDTRFAEFMTKLADDLDEMEMSEKNAVMGYGPKKTKKPNEEMTPEEMEEMMKRNKKKHSTMMVTKEASGKWRWTVLASGSYGPDRDGEWVTEAALKSWADSYEGTPLPLRANGEPVVARWWHVGKPDMASRSKGAGLDLGTCDFAMYHGKSLIMSGVFEDDEIGAVMAQKVDRLGVSIGFFHPPSEPANKEYRTLDIFEVSFLPVERASYPFTGLSVVKGS